MSRWLCIFALVCSLPCAAVAAPGDDDMGRFMADKGLLDRLEQVRKSVV